jgi:hypothetical protein
MVVRIGGRRLFLWRVVDDAGEVLDILVHRRRDKRAAVRLLRKLLKSQGIHPEALVTDKLGSYGAAAKAVADLPMGAQAAEVQVPRLGPEVPPRACRDLQHLQSSAPLDLATQPADPSSRYLWRLGECDRGRLNDEAPHLPHAASGG